jgi:hypothetical protein
MEEHLHIEVWDYNRIWFNTYIGYESLDLVSIVSGSFQRTVNVYDRIDADAQGPLKCTLQFKIIFEEQWDFYLKFMDWRSTNIEDEL